MRLHHQAGVTLLELMVALFIFALAAGALLKIAGEHANHAGTLETRYFASLAAQNHLVQLHLNEQPPALGRRRHTVELGGRRWSLAEEVKGTDNPLIREVNARVGMDEEGAEALIELRAFVGIER